MFIFEEGTCSYMKVLYQPFCKSGLLNDEQKGVANFAKRTALGVHPVGWTALFCMIFCSVLVLIFT